jgi:hypothetical protein
MTIPMPDWNDLPDDVRVKFVAEGRFYVCHDDACCGGHCVGGDCSLAMYNMFCEVMADFLPKWLAEKNKELALGDLLNGPYP